MGVIRYFCRHARGDYGTQHKLGSEIGGGYIYSREVQLAFILMMCHPRSAILLPTQYEID